MWFWINFSPIGQASPAPKKSSDLQNGKGVDMQPETKIDGQLPSITYHI
jgi:hypothetical protein